MEYTMEELVPVVGKLAEKYTAYESTSITYEKAEQLMGAVLYCIVFRNWSKPDVIVWRRAIGCRHRGRMRSEQYAWRKNEKSTGPIS